MIDFVGKRNLFFLIALVVIIPGIISMAVVGFNLGVDFTSGTAMTMKFDKKVELGDLREELTMLGHKDAIVQGTSEGNFFVRLSEITPDEKTSLLNSIGSALEAKITVLDFFTVSPLIATETLRNAIIAVVIATLGMLIYISWAFRKMPNPLKWGACAVLALLHDTLIVVGIFSIMGWLFGTEVDSLFVTGVLAVLGVSVNNIVVVFDRIRDNVNRGISKEFATTVNIGIVESVGRSTNTSLCALFAIVALYLFGGATIHNLVLALLIGIVAGIYSSLCIAGQLLVVWEKNK